VTRGKRRWLVALVMGRLCQRCRNGIAPPWSVECFSCRERRVLGITLKETVRGRVRTTP
jgi:hypothetical protein